METADKFCLRWNDFESNISVAFRELREDKDFFDVTLACDDDQIQAHKVILSACSPFFRTVLKRNKHEHPLLYLRGVKYVDLAAVLNFMYHGEVNVAQEELNTFLSIAEDLKVKGLTQNNSGHNDKPKQRLPSPKRNREPPERKSEPLPAPPPLAKKGRQESDIRQQDQYPQSSADVEDDIQEITPVVKAEPVSSGMEHQIVEPDLGATGPGIDHPMTMYGEEGDGYAEDYGMAYTEGDAGMGFDTSMMASNAVDGNKEERKRLIYSKICKRGVGTYECTDCGLTKSSSGLTALKNHVEKHHLDTSQGYQCNYCGKVLLTANSYNVHLNSHKNKEKNGNVYY